MQVNFTEKTKKQLIASYVNGTIKAKDISTVEDLVGSDPVYQYYYDRKVQEREFLHQMIPQEKLMLKEKSEMIAEIRAVNQDLMVEDVESLKDRIKSFLDKPFLTIRY